MQAQALLRKAIRDTTAELDDDDDDEEDPDKQHKDDDDDSDAGRNKSKPSRGRGKGRGRGRGRTSGRTNQKKPEQKESKTNNAEKELDDLPKSKKPRLVEQPDAANHTLPEDLDDAAKSAEEKAEQDVRDQAEDEQRDHDQEQQTAKPGKKHPRLRLPMVRGKGLLHHRKRKGQQQRQLQNRQSHVNQTIVKLSRQSLGMKSRMMMKWLAHQKRKTSRKEKSEHQLGHQRLRQRKLAKRNIRSGFQFKQVIQQIDIDIAIGIFLFNNSGDTLDLFFRPNGILSLLYIHIILYEHVMCMYACIYLQTMRFCF